MSVESTIPHTRPLLVGERVQTTDGEKWRVLKTNECRAVLHSTRRKYKPADRSVSPYAEVKRL
jgi:hypothetical protein